MTRVPNSNYSSSPYIRATDDGDRFDRDDLNLLAQALDLHDHADTRGLAVQRLGNNIIGSFQLQDNSVTDPKIGVRTINAGLVPDGSAQQLGNSLSQLANRIRTGFGVTNWYDTPAVPLTGKVTKTGDAMSGELRIVRQAASIPIDGGLYNASKLILQNVNSSSIDPPAIGFHMPGIAGVAMYQRPEGANGGWPLGLIDGSGSSRIVTDKNGGPGSNVHADLLDTCHAGNASGNIPINNGSVNLNLYSQFSAFMRWTGVGDFAAGNGTNNIPVNNAQLNTNLIAQYSHNLLVGGGWATGGNGSGNIPFSNGVVNANLNADLLDGIQGSQFVRNDTGGQQTIYGDIMTHRGNATGVIFLGNTGTRYLFWDGGSYILGGQGVVHTDASTNINATTLDGLDSTQFLRGDVQAAVVNSNAFQISPGEYIGLTTGADELGFFTQGVQRGYVDDGGGDLIWGSHIKATGFDTLPSDERLKENIVPLSESITEKFRNLRPVQFNYKGSTNPEIGFIAQDLQAVFPEAVVEQESAVDRETGLQDAPTFGYSIVPLLTFVIQHAQELDARVQVLEAR